MRDLSYHSFQYFADSGSDRHGTENGKKGIHHFESRWASLAVIGAATELEIFSASLYLLPFGLAVEAYRAPFETFPGISTDQGSETFTERDKAST